MSEPSQGAAEPRVLHTKVPPIAFAYAWPQASPCGAVVGYKQNGNELTLLTTIRAAHVGEGRSLMAGGFWEVATMLPKAPETMQDGNAELYRECHEELDEALKTLIPYEDFHARAEHLWDGMVRKGRIPPQPIESETPKPIPKRNAALYQDIYESLGDDIKSVLTPEQFSTLGETIWNRMVYKDGLGVHAVVQKSIRLSDDEFDAIMAMPNTDEQIGKKPETFLMRHYKTAAEAEKDIRTRLSDFKYPEEVDAVVRWYNKKNNDAVRAFGPGA